MSAVPPPLPPLPAARPRGWWDRHWKWAVALGVVLMLALVAAVVGGIAFALSKVKETAPYRHAMATVRGDPRAGAALGTPIEAGAMPSASFTASGRIRTAALSIPVEGPRGAGRVDAHAVEVDGTWRYDRLELRLADGSTLDLQPPP